MSEKGNVVRLEKQNEVMSKMADSLAQKMDGWKSIITGANIKGKDPTTSFTPSINIINEAAADNIYMTDDVASNICDRMAEEMTRAGFTITIEDDVNDLADQAMDKWDELGFDSKMKKGISIARLHGGAGGVLGVIDGSLSANPLIPEKSKGLAFMTILSRWQLTPVTNSIENDPSKENFGYPNFYMINMRGTGGQYAPRQLIHHSRVLRFVGVEVPPAKLPIYNYWGDSVLSRLKDILVQYAYAFNGISGALRNSDRLWFKMQNLADLIAQDEDDKVMKRIALLATTWSSLNIAVMQSDEEVGTLNAQTQGLSDLVNKVEGRLVTASGMPHTLILGDSPSGLGATGESEQTTWYDHVRNKQECELRPLIRRAMDCILASLNKGKIPSYSIEFNPLWQMNDQEKANYRKTIAEGDAIWEGMGAIDPLEIREGHFSGSSFSPEITLLEQPDLIGATPDPTTTDPQATPVQGSENTPPDPNTPPNGGK